MSDVDPIEAVRRLVEKLAAIDDPLITAAYAISGSDVRAIRAALPALVALREERDALRATNRDLHRRAQSWESLAKAEAESARVSSARLSHVADAFGSDPNDQNLLCVKARAAGAKLDILERDLAALRARVRELEQRLELAHRTISETAENNCLWECDCGAYSQRGWTCVSCGCDPTDPDQPARAASRGAQP